MKAGGIDMDVRAGDLKIGAVLGIGKYAPVGSNKMPSTVLWLKASDDCTLVAKHVLDYLIFDGREKIGVSNGWNEFIGNPDYYLSNLQQYLNSDALDWFMPMHDHDTPPDRSHSPCGGEYEGVPGFLHLFQPHEKASFVSGVRLLRINDLAAGSDSRFPLFKKKGIRATATDDLKEVRPMRVPAGTYVSYWMMDRRGSDGPNSALTLGKGVGAVYVRNPNNIKPLVRGGADQEFGLRGGTENVAGIVGFGKACEIMKKKMREIDVHTSAIKQNFYRVLTFFLAEHGLEHIVHVNGEPVIHSGKILNLRFDGVDAETLILMADSLGICLSAGSACHSHASEPSRVLLAAGLFPDEARSSVRISFSRQNTAEEVEDAAKKIAECVSVLHGNST